MDQAEQLVERYLKSRFGSVVYEPDGNIPPDFLCDSRVAVEVRRLNQQEGKTTGSPKGLEETSIPLVSRVRNLLKELGVPKDGHSWFVFYRFERPLPQWKAIGPLLKKHLEGFRDAPVRARTSVEITRGFELEIFRASRVFHNQFFVLGGYSDDDSGGWLLEEIQKSLTVCIQEKTHKISRVRHKYPEWWLVLVDHIGYGLDDLDRAMFHDQVKVEHGWDKVILVDPRNESRAFET